MYKTFIKFLNLDKIPNKTTSLDFLVSAQYFFFALNTKVLLFLGISEILTANYKRMENHSEKHKSVSE